MLELARSRTRAREDGRAISVLVAVHDCDRVLQAGRLQDMRLRGDEKDDGTWSETQRAGNGL